jgi:hypothetical protein
MSTPQSPVAIIPADKFEPSKIEFAHSVYGDGAILRPALVQFHVGRVRPKEPATI